MAPAAGGAGARERSRCRPKRRAVPRSRRQELRLVSGPRLRHADGVFVGCCGCVAAAPSERGRPTGRGHGVGRSTAQPTVERGVGAQCSDHQFRLGRIHQRRDPPNRDCSARGRSNRSEVVGWNRAADTCARGHLAVRAFSPGGFLRGRRPPGADERAEGPSGLVAPHSQRPKAR